MTSRQINLLGDRHKERVKREDRRAGELIAMFYNANRDSDKDPNGITWQDVFVEWKEVVEQTEEEMFETMMLLAKRTEGLPS